MLYHYIYFALFDQVCWGGKIPESYKNVKHELDLSKFTKKTIACGSSHQIDINITTPGSVIE